MIRRLHIYFHAVLNWIDTAKKTTFEKTPEGVIFVNVQPRMQSLEAFMNFEKKIFLLKAHLNHGPLRHVQQVDTIL